MVEVGRGPRTACRHNRPHNQPAADVVDLELARAGHRWQFDLQHAPTGTRHHPQSGNRDEVAALGDSSRQFLAGQFVQVQQDADEVLRFLRLRNPDRRVELSFFIWRVWL